MLRKSEASRLVLFILNGCIRCVGDFNSSVRLLLVKNLMNFNGNFVRNFIGWSLGLGAFWEKFIGKSSGLRSFEPLLYRVEGTFLRCLQHACLDRRQTFFFVFIYHQG